MTFLTFLWDYIIVFLFVLTVLVFVHEMGHFWIARRNGVRVEVFSIGFGPELFGRTDRHGTRWKFSAIPLGGYVKMFGENGDDPGTGTLTPAEIAVSFHHKRIGQRAAIIAAGPLANYAFAAVVLAILFGVVGNPRPLAAVGSLQDGSAAAAAGIHPGDRFVRLGEEAVVWFDDLRRVVRDRPGVTMAAVVVREGREITIPITPRTQEVEEAAGTMRSVGLLGVTPDPEQVRYESRPPLEAAWMGLERTIGMTGQILAYLGQVISGERDTDELGGPLRIAQMSGQMAQGGWVNLLFFMAALSINLGLINLFPIPMLDGGHLAFILAEAVRGRPLGARAQEYGFRFGLILVLLLMIFVTWKDLGHLKVIEFIKSFVT